jgi:hypothetical protein
MLFVSSYLLANQLFEYLAPSAVTVFAGSDTYTCQNQNLALSSLNALISGDNVTNGDWITLGDGKFLPSNSSSGRFSSSTTYVPGPNDRTLGFYRLLLIADPSMLNPDERVQDEVKVNFTSAPPIVCSSNLSISLNESCSQQIQVTMLVPNPQQPNSQYVLTVFDKNGNVIPNNIVNKNHLGYELSFKLGHTCTSNYCWGKLTVKDYFPPIFNCANDTIDCVRSIEPDSLGWPYPIGAFVDTIIGDNFIVKNWDACSDVTLRYVDEVIKGSCLGPVERRVKRTWHATDAYGNASTCDEWIVINRTNINNIVFPNHFDNVVHPAFECKDSFPHLANGFPSPDTTGVPYIGSCGHVQYSYTDIPFDLCGDSYKIVRSWFLIDWCTSLSVTKNQFIYVIDTEGPEVKCQDSIGLSTSIYSCVTDKVGLPAPTVLYDCNDTRVDLTIRDVIGFNISGSYLVKENDKFYVDDLPIGKYDLHYTVKDECNNATSCITKLTVSDQTEPYVACEQFTKVAVSADGKGVIFATTFDDNSFDNCGIASLKVRRMEASCGLMPAWSDRAVFCCDDIGTTRRVALEITDVHGNKNSCMVNVDVEDKEAPKITCPPHLTIECNYSYDQNFLVEFGTVRNDASKVKNVVLNNHYHNGVIGKDGLATDNCGFVLDSTININVTCFDGRIERKFIATDRGGNTAACVQTITLENPDPFDLLDITLPLNYNGEGCRPDDLLPAVTGQPTYVNTGCATVSATYEDQIFYRADGACIKIIRSWTIVDWCQFKQAGDPGKFGPFIQIIKINNTDKPTILSSCADTTICNYHAQCGKSNVIIRKRAHDECTVEDLLKWTYQVDIDDNGTVDLLGETREFKGELPNGRHKIMFNVDDQCGNTSTCTQYIDVVDCKAPSPYCLGQLAVTLDAQTKSATVWARDFDLGAQDNCTDRDELIFTFDGAQPVKSRLSQRHFFKGQGLLSDSTSYLLGNAQVWIPSTLTSGILVGCDDIPDGKSAIVALSVSVFDLERNVDSCSVDLLVNDSNNVCPDVITASSASGRVLTDNGKVVHGVALKATSDQSEFIISTDTIDGFYHFDHLPLDNAYTIEPSKRTGLSDGVSTLDLVKIQRHILDLAPLESPYRMIAADVNNSKSITASDLVDLRKLILGIYDRFPKQANPWTFVPADYVFADPKEPFYYDRSKQIDQLSGEIADLDFIAIKLGDVNETATGRQLSSHVNSRVSPSTFLYDVDIAEPRNLHFEGPKSTGVDGFQLFISDIDFDVELVSSSYFTDMEWVQLDGTLAIVATSALPIDYDGHRPFFSIESKSDLDKSKMTGFVCDPRSEIYILEEPRELVISRKESANKVESFKIQSNPVFSDLILSAANTSSNIQYRFEILDVFGRVVSTFVQTNHTDDSQIVIPLSTEMPSGHYQIRIANPLGFRQNLPFIFVK